ncbi:hypothetical protein D3C79_803040 [compost metagenome]
MSPPPWRKSSAWSMPAWTSCASRCRTWTPPRRSARSSNWSACRWSPTSTSTTRSPCAWPNWASTACVSTRATSAVKTVCVRWSMPPATGASRSASASTPAPWKRTCRRSTANRPRQRWSSRPCATSSTSTAWTSRTSRSASRPPTCSWPSKPTACWPSRSCSRCTWASPKPVACVRGR